MIFKVYNKQHMKLDTFEISIRKAVNKISKNYFEQGLTILPPESFLARV